MKVLRLTEIRAALARIDVLGAVEAGFVAYSAGRAVVGPVGELVFREPPGDVHIKYGYLEGGSGYVVKIASGFYDNPKHGLPSSNGVMLVFDQRTGALQAVLCDEGLLTDVRTAAAGALAARALAPRRVARIGIVGCGVQARLQLEWLARVTECRDALVWGRSREARERYARDLAAHGFRVEPVDSAERLARACRLIVTTTPATAPLVWADWIAPGTHVTAVGADAPHKQELDPAILGRAARVVADSIRQSKERGEIAHALRTGLVREQDLVELGDVLARRAPGRTADDEITVADLTGVAVQDIQIATAVWRALA